MHWGVGPQHRLLQMKDRSDRPSGVGRTTVKYDATSRRAASRLQRLIEFRGNRLIREEALRQYWQALERNDAKALKRNGLRKWHL